MQDQMPLLTRARLALRNRAYDDAQQFYRQHLALDPNDVDALQELAGTLFAQARPAEAEQVLDRALDLRPDSTALRFNRALARQSQGLGTSAMADLDAVLAAEPDNLHGRLQRGAIRFHSGDPGAALEDFLRVGAIAPAEVEGHFNAGLALLRLGRGGEALEHLTRALSIAPGQPLVIRALANTLRETGRLDEALARYDECLGIDPDNPITHADHGMCLLRAGRAEQAIAAFERSLALDPSDQTALAGLYLASNESGQAATADQLMDYDFCVRHDRLQPDAADALREAVLAHPALRWEPSGKTTRQGEQTAFLDLSPGSPFAAFAAQVQTAIAARLKALVTAADADLSTPVHPWLRGMPKRYRLNMWATVLREGGHQGQHIHPAGWMSGVFYLDDGGGDADGGGAIVFGRGPDELGLTVEPKEWRHQPRTGDLLLFPSYFYHHTRPFHGPRTRISLAFDVVPGL